MEQLVDTKAEAEKRTTANCGDNAAAILLPSDTLEDGQNQNHSKLGRLLDRLIIIKTVKVPFEYNRNIKWLITFLISGAAAVDPISSTIFYRTQATPSMWNMLLTCLCSGSPRARS